MTENLFTADCIRTFTGLYINVFEPSCEMICIEDIAHGLSMQCRFGGHLPEFYSVAQHSVLCAHIAKEGFKLEALLHDASEAYLMDIPSPIKNRMPEYKAIENKLMQAIAGKFGFRYPLREEIKVVDRKMLVLEWDDLMIGGASKDRFKCWSSGYAEERFLKMYDDLANGKSRFLKGFEKLKNGQNL